MKGFPKTTDLKKQIPKTVLYKKYSMDSKAREKFDHDISRIYLVNEISTHTMNIEEGQEIKSFFVIQINLKNKKYDVSNIVKITKFIDQNMILKLKYDDEECFAVYHVKLITSAWEKQDKTQYNLRGLNLDVLWKKLVAQIGLITVDEGNTLEEQIVINEESDKLVKKIIKLEKKARIERQPRRKYEIVERINDLKRILEEM